MTGMSHGSNIMIARAFQWKDYHTFVDVGTGQGDLAAQIALANPHLRARGSTCPKWRRCSRSTSQRSASAIGSPSRR